MRKTKFFNIVVMVLAVVFISATIAEAGKGDRNRGRDSHGDRYSNNDRHRHNHHRNHNRHHRNHRSNKDDFVVALGMLAGVVVVTKVVDAMIHPRTYVINNHLANQPPATAQVWVEGHWERGTWIPAHYEWIQVYPGAK